MGDRAILFVAAFLRALATGAIAVLLASYLALRGFAADVVGVVVAAGLAGNTAALLVVTFVGDRIDPRRGLVVIAMLSAIGAAVAAMLDAPFAIAAAAALGMLNGMGRDRGAALAIEQSVLPSTTTDDGRTRAFAWYNALQDVGHALGALGATVPSIALYAGVAPIASHRASIVACGALSLACLALYTRLSAIGSARTTAPLSAESRRVLVRVSALFALDSFGGGFLTTALLSYFLFERFAVGPAAVALLFFGARVANVASHFGAAWLARKIGLLRTMVFTHVPSSVLLLTVAYAPTFPIAAALFLLREGLVEMDVPTRQSYVMALVRPEERGRASALTNLVRMGAWTVSSLLGGVLMARASLALPLVLGAAMKLAYDAALYRAFRGVRAPEEARLT
jgi:MFS family permease